MGFANIYHRLLPKQRADYSDIQLGAVGEKIAVRFLERSDYRVLDRNWKSPFGELDVVCSIGDTIVIVEVKTSRRLSEFPPEIRVNSAKQRKLRKLTRYYFKQHHLDSPVRFDIIAVWWENEKPQIKHIQNAF